MSVAERSCAANIWSRRSGWLDREGGERRSVRGGTVVPFPLLRGAVDVGCMSELLLSTGSVEGAMVVDRLI